MTYEEGVKRLYGGRDRDIATKLENLLRGAPLLQQNAMTSTQNITTNINSMKRRRFQSQKLYFYSMSSKSFDNQSQLNIVRNSF